MLDFNYNLGEFLLTISLGVLESLNFVKACVYVVYSPVSTLQFLPFYFSECSCGCERLGGKESYCEQSHIGPHHLVPHRSDLLGVQCSHYRWKAGMVRMLNSFISR